MDKSKEQLEFEDSLRKLASALKKSTKISELMIIKIKNLVETYDKENPESKSRS